VDAGGPGKNRREFIRCGRCSIESQVYRRAGGRAAGDARLGRRHGWGAGILIQVEEDDEQR